MGLISFVGRLLLVSIFVLSTVHHVQNFDDLAQNTVGPVVVEHLKKFSAATGVDISAIPLNDVGVYALGAALFFSGVGSLLTVFGVKAGYFFLVLFLVPVTVMMHPFWDAQGDAAQEQMKSFLLNTSLTGALLALLGSSCSAPASKGAAPSKVTKGKKKN